MFVCLFVAYRVSFAPKSREDVFTLPRFFGFGAGGSYDVSHPPGQGECFGAAAYICTKDEFAVYASIPCNIKGPLPLRGNVTKAGDYQVLVFGSDKPVDVVLRNSDSYLDVNQQPCLFEKPILAAFSGLLLLFWFVNWLLNLSFRLNLHACFTMTYLFSVVYAVVHFGELWHYNASDEKSVLTEFRIFTKFVADTFMLATLLMAAKGWSIVRASLTRWQVVACFVITLFYTIPSAVVVNVLFTRSWAVYLVLIFLFFGMIVYMRDVARSVEQSMYYVLGHMMVIADDGFDVKTTPIWNKYVMFRGLRWGLLAYMPLRLLIQTIEEVFLPPYWVGQTLFDTLTLCWLTASAVLFRLKKNNNSSSYMMISDHEGQEPRQLDRDSLNGISIDSDQMQQGTRKWEEGVELPPQPIFIDDLSLPRRQTEEENRENGARDTTPL